ncbi:hypothetical protein LTS06_012803, partial [Exophiala xenobiotica]
DFAPPDTYPLSFSPSPANPHLKELNRLLSSKPQRSWSVEYCGSSTPEVYPSDYLLQLLSSLEYWKGQAIYNNGRVRLLDPSTDHRMSIESFEYWRIEATYMTQEFFDITQRRNQERWEKTQK